MGELRTEKVAVTLSGKQILNGISLILPEGRITAIIGPNGSGKSTYLKTLAKNLQPSGGSVFFSGQDLRTVKGRDFAKKLAVLYQSPKAPGDITVRDLVEYGRFPHQTWWKGQSGEEKEIVAWSMAQTGLTEYAERPVITLSGGEQQRAWIAMALAQKPKTLLLDEPTTYLDIAHQLEILELIARLNQETGLSVVMVLHDLNQAAKYADQLVVFHQGAAIAAGDPAEVLTPALLRQVFKVEVNLWHDKDNKPVFVTKGLAQEPAQD